MRPDTRILLAWVGCLAAFVALALYAATRDSPGIDLDGIRAVQHAPALLGDVFDAVAFCGGGRPLTAITAVAVLAFMARGRTLETALLALTVVPRALTNVVKALVEAPRPPLTWCRCAAPSRATPSLPVTSWVRRLSSVLLFVFADKLRLPDAATLAIRAVSVLMVGSIGLARVWQGAHWPSDTVGGYLFAAVWLISMLRLHAAIVRRAKGSSAST